MNVPQSADWQTPYQEALLEADEKKLKEKILLTEWRIFERLRQLSCDDNHHEERQAIQDALRTLLVLKRDALHYPDWQS